MWPFIPGEGFPYSNFHSMNQDWIIKTIKQLLDNYDTIAQTVDASKLELIATKEELEGLLNQWYTTHSADITRQLANAIADFNTAVENTILTIPEDYSDFYNAFKKEIKSQYLMEDYGFAPYSDTLPASSNGIDFTATADGGIRANGTATGTATFYVRRHFTIPSNINRVSLSGCPSGGADDTYRLSFAKYTTGEQYEHQIADTGTGAEFDIVDHSAEYLIVIRIVAGTQIDKVFYPSLRDTYNLSNKILSANAAYGINLITLPYRDGSFTNRSGVDAVGAWNGSVKLSSQGVNDSNINYYVKTDIVFPSNVRRVKISGCPSNPAINKFCIRLGLYNPTGSGTSGWNTVATDYGEGAEVDILPGGRYLLVITALPLQAFSNIVFMPTITDADNVSIRDTQESIYGNAKILFLRTTGTYQGDCTIISAGAVNGLVDMGYDENCTTLIAQLTNNRINKLNFVIITHYHSDHATNDFVTSMNNLQNAGIDFSECVFYLPHKGVNWSAWIGTDDNKEQYEAEIKGCLNVLNIPYVQPDENQVFAFNKNFIMRFFNTQLFTGYYDYLEDMNENPTDHTNYNSFSMITELTIYGKKILMTADITPIAQENMYKNIRGCDIYKVEHHGINAGSSDAWLNSINPQFAVVPQYNASYTDVYTFTRKTVRTLANRCSIYSTQDGMVTAIINASTISLYGGMATFPGYGNITVNTLSELAGMYLAGVAYAEDATDITTEQTNYCTVNGKYILVDNTVYFVMALHYIANINAGLGPIVSNLPAPKDPNVLFLETSGAKYITSLTYNNGWRVNGRHNADSYGFVAGLYEVQPEE